jgi:beta-1,4-mannosyltransferase
MMNIYIYPKVFPCENPYINDLEQSLSTNFEIINKEANRNGVLDLFKFFLRTDIYYFNWIESLPSRRYGKIQIIAFVVFLMLAKWSGKKIVWTLHNKYTHDKNKNGWVDYMYNIMMEHSDVIFTHSQSGIDFVKEKYPASAKKIKYFIHPVKPVFPMIYDKKCIYDFFIWGTIWPYKGVIEFLRFLKESGKIHPFKILIAGRCINNQIRTELDKYLMSNITYKDEYYSIEEIAGFSNQAKFTLFTYKSESVLSSGSLMDSIRMRSVIIGPDIGAFRDLSSYDFVKTYNTYGEIIEIYTKYENTRDSMLTETEEFCLENSWNSFGEKLNDALILNLNIK